MTTSGTKASLPQDVEEAGIRSVGKIRPVRKPGATNAKGRASTASKSVKSISSAYNTNVNRTPIIDVQNDAISANLSRYFLLPRFKDLKEDINVIQPSSSSSLLFYLMISVEKNLSRRSSIPRSVS